MRRDDAEGLEVGTPDKLELAVEHRVGVPIEQLHGVGVGQKRRLYRNAPLSNASPSRRCGEGVAPPPTVLPLCSAPHAECCRLAG